MLGEQMMHGRPGHRYLMEAPEVVSDPAGSEVILLAQITESCSRPPGTGFSYEFGSMSLASLRSPGLCAHSFRRRAVGRLEAHALETEVFRALQVRTPASMGRGSQ